jgi:hypothetical protein
MGHHPRITGQRRSRNDARLEGPPHAQDVGHASDGENDVFTTGMDDADVFQENYHVEDGLAPIVPVQNATLMNGSVPWLRSLVLQGNTFAIPLGKSLMALADVNINTAVLRRIPVLVSAMTGK